MTSIEWTDKTWNPVRGCSRVSEGCRNCYAEKIAGRFDEGAFKGFAELRFSDATKGGDGRFHGHWTGKVELIPEKLDEPLRWRKPQRVFVNSMSDLFHESLSDEAIAAVFGVMASAPQHTYQVLTKRPKRMLSWFSAWSRAMASLGAHPVAECKAWAEDRAPGLKLNAGLGVNTPKYEIAPWPLPNVWLGVSCEDQATADERIPLLLQTPAAVRFVSYEPALGPVDFTAIKRTQAEGFMRPLDGRFRTLDWVIVGGESGPGARPFDVEWARSTVRQCKAAGVPVFVKQLGARPFDGYLSDIELVEGGKGRPRPADQPLSPDEARAIVGALRVERRLKLRDPKGGDPSEWSEDLRVREFPKETS